MLLRQLVQNQWQLSDLLRARMLFLTRKTLDLSAAETSLVKAKLTTWSKFPIIGTWFSFFAFFCCVLELALVQIRLVWVTTLPMNWRCCVPHRSGPPVKLNQHDSSLVLSRMSRKSGKNVLLVASSHRHSSLEPRLIAVRYSVPKRPVFLLIANVSSKLIDHSIYEWMNEWISPSKLTNKSRKFIKFRYMNTCELCLSMLRGDRQRDQLIC